LQVDLAKISCRVMVLEGKSNILSHASGKEEVELIKSLLLI
jgi:hypothetical protein